MFLEWWVMNMFIERRWHWWFVLEKDRHQLWKIILRYKQL